MNKKNNEQNNIRHKVTFNKRKFNTNADTVTETETETVTQT